jgi:FkbM family methyltransferase
MLIPMHDLVEMSPWPITGIIHAGAHLGEECNAYRQANVQKVLWIEGNPELIPRLCQNVSRWGHKVCNTLVGSAPGEVLFHVANNGQSSSVLELGTHLEKHPEVHYISERMLPVRTIDDIMTAYGAGYNFMNLDLQGYELEALRGATETLRTVDYIYTEVNVDELYLGCARLGEIDEFLSDFERVAISMVGDTGWGDAFYVRIRDDQA